MPAKIEGRKNLQQTKLKELVAGDSLFTDFPEQSESEIKWVKLHQMFDR